MLNLREISGKTGSKCFVGENVYCLLYLSFSSLSLFAGLLSLDLSYNLLIDLDLASFENLGQLRHLKLSHNKLANLPSHCWRFIPYLASLDISFNPIRVLTKESFYGLQRLQNLMVHDLPDLKRFDADSLTQLTYLSDLHIQSWPEIEKFKFRLGSVISGLASLKSLKAKILEPSHILTDQLLGAFGPKLKEIEITGPLRAVTLEAFEGVENNYELLLAIRNTNIDSLPEGFHKMFQNIVHFSLDIRDNKFQSLAPSILYGNKTHWEQTGTKTLQGEGKMSLLLAINNAIKSHHDRGDWMCLIFCPFV